NRWRLDPYTLEHWRSIDPQAFDRIKQLALDGPQSINVEALIAASPDLVVLDPFFAAATHAIERVERAGIPVAILTLEVDLGADRPGSGIEKLAKLIDRREQGVEVARFIRERVERIRTR